MRVFTLLHDARPVLLNLGGPGAYDVAPWADRVQLVDADVEGAWELPVLGEVPAPAAVLIRPDGYVAWVGDGTDVGLEDALTALVRAARLIAVAWARSGRSRGPRVRSDWGSQCAADAQLMQVPAAGLASSRASAIGCPHRSQIP